MRTAHHPETMKIVTRSVSEGLPDFHSSEGSWPEFIVGFFAPRRMTPSPPPALPSPLSPLRFHDPIPPSAAGAVAGSTAGTGQSRGKRAAGSGVDQAVRSQASPPARLGDRGAAARSGQHARRSGADRSHSGAPAVAGRLHLLPLECRAFLVDCRPVAAAAARLENRNWRPGSHGRQRLGARSSGRRLRRAGRRRGGFCRSARGRGPGCQPAAYQAVAQAGCCRAWTSFPHPTSKASWTSATAGG